MRQFANVVQVDFASDPVMLLKPHKVVIRRSFRYGIWLQHRTSAHQTQLHLMLHRLQVLLTLPLCAVSTTRALLKHSFNGQQANPICGSCYEKESIGSHCTDRDD